MNAPYSVVENIMVNKHYGNGKHNSKMYMQETKHDLTKRFHFLVFVEILKIGSDLLHVPGCYMTRLTIIRPFDYRIRSKHSHLI